MRKGTQPISTASAAEPVEAAPGADVPAEVVTIKGDNGRTYRQRPDGRLQEVYVPADAANRQLAAIGESHTITGVRIVNAQAPDEPAIMVLFEGEESAAMLEAVRAVLSARTSA